MPGALLFVDSLVVPAVVMVAVTVMLIVTIRQILSSGQRDRDKPRNLDDSAYISSSSDPREAVVRTASVRDAEEDDSTPINMSQSEPSVYTGEELEDHAAANVSIKSFNFRTFDADTGPPDHNCFYDELILELYDANTGRVWLTSYYVATPAGLAKFMKDENWKAMFADSHIVVPSYARASLVDAILRQLNGAWEVSSHENEGADRSG